MNINSKSEIELNGKDEKNVFEYFPPQKVYKHKSIKSWLKLITFYVVFIFIIFLIWLFMFLVFYQLILDPRVPYLRNGKSSIGSTPGLSIRPRPPVNNIRSTLISFKSTDRNTYKHYVNDLQSFLDTYIDVKHGSDIAGLHSCFGRLTAPEGQYCPFDINTEIKQTSVCFNASREFGYADGKPCILLKINNIFDWIADPYLQDKLPPKLESHLKYTGYRYTEPLIYFTCEGENHADIENIGQIEYVPKPGVAPYYFPFQNPDGYRSPFVFVRFSSPTAGILINVECKAWAKNIDNSKYLKAGTVHFELLVN